MCCDALFQIGDEITAINGTSADWMSDVEALQFLNRIWGPITLRIIKGDSIQYVFFSFAIGLQSQFSDTWLNEFIYLIEFYGD